MDVLIVLKSFSNSKLQFFTFKTRDLFNCLFFTFFMSQIIREKNSFKVLKNGKLLYFPKNIKNIILKVIQAILNDFKQF